MTVVEGGYLVAASFLTGSCAIVVAGFLSDGVRRGASAGLVVVLMVLVAAGLAVDAPGLTGSLLGEALRCSDCLLAEERSVGFRRDRVRASEDMLLMEVIKCRS